MDVAHALTIDHQARGGRTGCLKYREVIDQVLDDQMHHGPLKRKLCSTRGLVGSNTPPLEVGSSKLGGEASPEEPAQTPAPVPTSPVVFNVTVPESVMAGQNHQVPRSR